MDREPEAFASRHSDDDDVDIEEPEIYLDELNGSSLERYYIDSHGEAHERIMDEVFYNLSE